MKATTDRTFARLAILEYLRESGRERTAKEIHSYLLENTDWGESQRKKKAGDQGKQNVERWIKNMRTGEYRDDIEFKKNPENLKQKLYSAIIDKEKEDELKRKDVAERMSIDEACFLGLAEKFLDVVLPTNIHDSMRERFLAAQHKLSCSGENQQQKKNRAINNYISRIDAVPRGQELFPNKVPYAVISELSKAIMNGQCVKFKYKGESQFKTYHPYGIIIREPKIYLLGVEYERMRKKGPGNTKISQYLCNRIESPAVTSKPNRVPKNFSTRKFIRDGKMSVEIHELKELVQSTFTLKLRFYNGDDNLRLDLEEFPISAKQTIADEPGTNNFVLTAPGMRASTHLVDWIMGRMDRVEVLEPVELRKYVAARIKKMHGLYT